MQPQLAEEIPTTLPLNLRTGAAQIHGGITIIPILAAAPALADYTTLGSAQPLGFTIEKVDAAGHVPELLVHNPLDVQVMLYDGEEVVGAKQNRMLEATILVAAGSTQKIPVACVEAGRWTRISDDFTASDRVSHPESRRRKSYDLESAPLSFGVSQGTIWDEIEERLEERSLHSSTRALADVHDAERPRIDALEAAFPLVTAQCGAILGLDGTFCLDYVSRCDAWEALWPKIRRGYLLDGLRHLEDLPASPELIARFVANVSHAPRTQRPSPGLGLDQRLHGTAVTGSGLMLADELLQPQPSREMERAVTPISVTSSTPRARPALRDQAVDATSSSTWVPSGDTIHPCSPCTQRMLDPSMNDTQRAYVDEIFAAYVAQDPPMTPGVAYGVVMDGVLVHAGGLGTLHVGEQQQPGTDSSFRIASMTKSFVAATLLLLHDEGVLRLDDTAEQWVPELQGLPLATSDSRPPTLRQLLSMNSGYPEDDPWADRLESLSDDEYSALMGEPKTFARTSGIAFDYSNIGFTLLGRVIQNATGQPYRAIITERILAPLGLRDTTWSDDGVDPARLATGYALVDGEWIAQPIQSPGAFSALGGLYSTVADLAVWVAGFIDAWPPRNGDDQHPLSRASRREMQQVVTAMPLQLGAGEGLLRAQAHGYCFGLMSAEDFATGRTIGHSGGYPGFGSRMTWHPASRIGVIALANGRYARPGGAVADALAALVSEEPRRLRVEPLPALAEIRTTINAALIAGDFAAIEPLLAFNVDLDETLDRRSSQVASLAAIHGALTPEAKLTVMTPTQVAWWLAGEQGRVGVEIMLNPEQPSTVQKLDVTSVLPSTPELDDAVAGALEAVKRGADLSSLLLPICSASWVACDGANTGTVRLVGAKATIRLKIDLAAEQVATFEPDERWPTSA